MILAIPLAVIISILFEDTLKNKEMENEENKQIEEKNVEEKKKIK